ncbi:MAG: YncE family protein [Actinomycetota bacterium]
MRYRLFGTVAAVAALVVAGCGQAGPGAGPRPDDVLFLQTAGGITLVKAVPDAVAISLSGAVPSTDWSAVVRTMRRKGETRIVAHDTTSGARLWSREISGRFEVKVAADRAGLVALGTPVVGTGYPVGRSSTTLVVLDGGSEPRTITLEGNYEPEAFSTDGQSLFVVEYVPPRHPDRYRVRRLDLGTEEVVGVYTVDAELQETMRGTARVQAASPDGKRLYTLYSLKEADGTKRSFVHVLSLDELWAHCVDLPAGFATGSERRVALSVSPDGSRLYVADATTEEVAEVDTEALAVTRSSPVAFASPGAPAHAVYGPDGVLYLASGRWLRAADASTLTEARSWDMAGKITGIQAATDGIRLYVGLEDRIIILDTATGRIRGELRPGDIGTITQLGRSTRSLDEGRKEITCAC